MIRHEYKRKTAKKRSLKSLKSYLHYLADPTEKDHAPKGMVLLSGRNHLCTDDSPEAFHRAVRERHQNYLKVRDGLAGKRSALLWEEVIYNLGRGVFHTEEERDFIETLIISRIFPQTPSRRTWHINPKTGWDDLHILVAAKTMQGTMSLARTEVPLAKRLQQLDKEIAAYLNSRPNPKRKHVIKSSRRVADEKAEKRHQRRGVPMPCPLPEQLARLAGDEEITLESIYKWLGDLGIRHEPTRNGKGLKFTYPKLRKTGSKYRNARGSYPFRELLLRTQEARFDLDLVKCQEKYQDVIATDNIATAESVSTTTNDSTIAKTTPAKSTATTTPAITKAKESNTGKSNSKTSKDMSDENNIN
jgi:hypothetical protein